MLRSARVGVRVCWVLLVCGTAAVVAAFAAACGSTDSEAGTLASSGGDASASGGTTAASGANGLGGDVAPGVGGTGGDPTPSGGTGGAGATDAVGEVRTLGEACSPAGALACAGNYQKLGLVCGASGTWESNITCPGTEVCDTRPGLTAGSCQEQEPNCLGHDPGYLFCLDNDVHECGPDNVDSPVLQECTGLCSDGACDDTVDACPTVPIAVNCSDTCGGPTDNCVTAECSTLWDFEVDADAYADNTFALRTPSAPGTDSCQCGGSGPGVAPEYSMLITVPFQTTPRLIVEVDPPWQLRVSWEAGAPPCSPAQGEQCVIFTASMASSILEVFTYDPAAPAKNVSVRPSDDPYATECPAAP